MTRSKVPKWIKRGEGKVPIGAGSNMPMNFHSRDARKPRPAQNKGRMGGIHMAKDNKRK